MPTPSELAHRVVVLEQLLNLNDTTLQSIFHLSEACANLLGLLLSCGTVPLKLEGEDLGGIVNPRTTVQRLRRQLKPYGIDVHVRRGVGYFLDDAARQAIKRILDRERSQPLPLTMPGGGPRLTERESLCVERCTNIPYDTLADPTMVLVPVPAHLVKGVRWLTERVE